MTRSSSVRYRGIQTQFGWNRARFNVGGGYTGPSCKATICPKATDRGRHQPVRLLLSGVSELRAPRSEGNAPRRSDSSSACVGRIRHPVPGRRTQCNRAPGVRLGRAYSAIGNINAGPTGTASCLTSAVTTVSPCASKVVANPGYLLTGIGDSHAYYFSERGAFRTEAVTSTDLSLNYRIPIGRVELFAQGQLSTRSPKKESMTSTSAAWTSRSVRLARTARRAGLKAFNPFTETPIQCPQGQTAAQCTALGAHWQLGPNFGKAVNKDAYQSPRTYRFGVGIRF